MIRNNPPFNGNRYILNTNTGEIHDLYNESTNCHIDSIKPEHIYTTDNYDDAIVHAVMVEKIPNPNGCFHCIPSRDIG